VALLNECAVKALFERSELCRNCAMSLVKPARVVISERTILSAAAGADGRAVKTAVRRKNGERLLRSSPSGQGGRSVFCKIIAGGIYG
jgi:hypothetical protein